MGSGSIQDCNDEVGRYRKALEEIIDYPAHSYKEFVTNAVEIARTALTEPVCQQEANAQKRCICKRSNWDSLECPIHGWVNL